MTNKPFAIKLAEEHENNEWIADTHQWREEAATELRRLHEVNAELLEALKLADAMLSGANMNANAVEKAVRTAIAKATGEQA